MTIEFRPHPQIEPSLIDGLIEEVKGERIDWLKHPGYMDHNGYKECPLTIEQVNKALTWAWAMQEKYHGTARVVLHWFGQLTPEAMAKISEYPEVSPHYDYIKNPDMDGNEEAKRRKDKMTREWKQRRDKLRP